MITLFRQIVLKYLHFLFISAPAQKGRTLKILFIWISLLTWFTPQSHNELNQKASHGTGYCHKQYWEKQEQHHLKLLLSPSVLKCVDCCLSWSAPKNIDLFVSSVSVSFQRLCAGKSGTGTRRVIFQVTGTSMGALGHLEMSRCPKAQFKNSSEKQIYQVTWPWFLQDWLNSVQAWCW